MAIGGSMRGKTLSRWLFGTLLLGISRMHAAPLVLVTHTGNAWSFSDADSILINGKEKVRSVPLAELHSDSWDAKTLSRLADIPLDSLSVIMRASDGRLLARSEAPGWALLLPDNAKNKAPQSA